MFETTGQSWLELMGPAALRISIVVTAVLLLLAIFRRQSASARSFVWHALIAVVALIPLLSLSPQLAQISIPSIGPIEVIGDPAEPVAPTVPTISGETSTAGSDTPSIDRGDAGSIPATPQADVNNSSFPSLSVPSIGWIVGLIWLIGVAVTGGRYAIRLWKRQRLIGGASDEVPAYWKETLHRQSQALGIQRSVRLMWVPLAISPQTWGIWRPAILLPRDAMDWPLAKLEIVLIHELAHVRRRDNLWSSIADALVALYWWNPLMRILRHRVRLVQDQACDDLVLAAGNRSTEYAEYLLAIARRIAKCPRFAG